MLCSLRELSKNMSSNKDSAGRTDRPLKTSKISCQINNTKKQEHKEEVRVVYE